MALGLDFHGLLFLSRVRRLGPFGRTLTVGRQQMAVSQFDMARLFGTQQAAEKSGPYADVLLRGQFGACSVDSIDKSDYEGSTINHDLNLPVPKNLYDAYDTIIDLGSSEHIFDVAQAFENYARMLSIGGRVIHVLPANNFLGHGFWQVSPEVFFSRYSNKNGFGETSVFVAPERSRTNFFRVVPPPPGGRVAVRSASPLYVLAHSTKVSEGRTEDVQQSDYVEIWSVGAKPGQSNHAGSLNDGGKRESIPRALLRLQSAFILLQAIRRFRRNFLDFLRFGCHRKNPHLEKLSIDWEPFMSSSKAHDRLERT